MIHSRATDVLSEMRDADPTPSLLAAVVAGDAAARDALVDLWGPSLLRWCARLGGPGVDPDDAAHDVLERALERLHTVRDPRAFGTWLFRITRRVLVDHRRRAWVRRWVPGLAPELPDPSDGPHRRYVRDEQARRVQEVLESLPASLREVLVLCELEERPSSQVAEMLDVPLGTVKSRLRRAREAFLAEARGRGLSWEDELDLAEESGWG